MASSSYTLSRPLPSSSARVGLRALKYGRHSRSAPFRLQTMTTARGLRYQNEEEAGHGDNGDGIAATTRALRLVASDDDAATEFITEEARVRDGALSSPPEPPHDPREGSGGSGGKVHAVPPTLPRLPKEKEPAAKAEASISDDE